LPPPADDPLAVHPEGVGGRVDLPEPTAGSRRPPSREAVSLRAVWLDPLPVWGFLGVPRARSFEAFRGNFEAWPILPLNVVYADADGTIGYQLIGQVPRRAGGNGLMPVPADA